MSLRAAAIGGGTGGGGGAPFPGYISQRWYSPYMGATIAVGPAGANTTLSLIPFSFPVAVSIASLGMRVGTAAAGNAMLGLYAHDAIGGKPTGPVLASVQGLSTAVVASVGADLATPVVFQAGLYWVASELDNATAALYGPILSPIAQQAVVGDAALASASTSSPLNYQVTNTYGTFPDLTAAALSSTAAGKAAVVFYKVT